MPCYVDFQKFKEIHSMCVLEYLLPDRCSIAMTIKTKEECEFYKLDVEPKFIKGDYMRTIKIHVNKPEEVNWQEYYKAIGYFTDWATERFPFVNIYGADTTGLVAVYSLTLTGQSKYTIAAVWDGNKYSFHS